MKYSLFFLAFIVLLSALVVNGWNQHRYCNDLAQKIESKTSQLNNVPVPILPDDRSEVERYRLTYSHLVNAFEAKKIDVFDLASVSTELAVVGRIPSKVSSEPAQPEKFKIRIPGDRKVEIRAEFLHGQQVPKNRFKTLLLPPGEYVFKITSETEQNEDGPNFLNIVVDIDNLDPVRWIHELDFWPYHHSDACWELFDLSWTQSLNPSGEPTRLLSERHSSPKTGEGVDIVISVLDVTRK